MATLRERQPGVWLARVFVDGKQVGRTFRGSKREVTRAVAAWEADLTGTSSLGASALVSDLLRLWQEARADSWQPTTARDYASRCRMIDADLGPVRLVDLDPLRVDRWLAKMRRDGVGAGAIRARFGAFKAACSWGVSRRMLRSNPVVDAAPRLAVGRRSVRPEPEQVVALLAAAAEESARAGLALRLAAVTGAREAELVALAWDDVTGDVLRIARQRHGVGEVILRERTKTGKARQVTLDSGTVRLIDAWHEEADRIAGDETRWMLSEAGAELPPSPRWLYEVFKRAGHRAGVPTGRADGFVLHDLRHWAASTALRDGHDPVTVAARLGHSPDTLLRIYAQEIEKGQNAVAASLAARLDG
jgi:integrase